MEILRVRRAVESDAGQIVSIQVRGWQWAYRGQVPDSYLDGMDNEREKREARRRERLAIQDGEERTWVAERGERILGFAVTGPSRDEDASAAIAELFAIYVDPHTARQGIGNRLLAQAVDDLRRRGNQGATLWVLAGNDRARRFYEHNGWTADGVTKVESRWDFDLHEVRYGITLDTAGPGSRVS